MNGMPFSTEGRFYQPLSKHCRIGPGSYQTEKTSVKQNSKAKEHPAYKFDKSSRSLFKPDNSPGPGSQDNPKQIGITDGMDFTPAVSRKCQTPIRMINLNQSSFNNSFTGFPSQKNKNVIDSIYSSSENSFGFKEKDKDQANAIDKPQIFGLTKRENISVVHNVKVNERIAGFQEFNEIMKNTAKDLAEKNSKTILNQTSANIMNSSRFSTKLNTLPNVIIADHQIQKNLEKIRSNHTNFKIKSDQSPGPSYQSIQHKHNLKPESLNRKELDKVQMKVQKNKTEPKKKILQKEIDYEAEKEEELRQIEKKKKLDSLPKLGIGLMIDKKALTSKINSSLYKTAFNDWSNHCLNLMDQEDQVERFVYQDPGSEEEKVVLKHVGSLRLFFVHMNYRFESDGTLALRKPNLEQQVFTDYFNDEKLFKIRFEILSLSEAKSIRIGLKHNKDGINFDHSFDLSGKLQNMSTKLKSPFDVKEDSLIKFKQNQGTINFFIDDTEVFEQSIPMRNQVFQILITNTENSLKVKDCSFNVKQDTFSVRQEGSIQIPGYNLFNY